MDPIRVIDLGEVSPVSSQAIYHALAYAMDETVPDTVVLVSSSSPYVSIGYHQDPTKELDLDFCTQKNLPVIRREVGGGAVYLDSNQVFCQWIFQRSHLPPKLEDRFALYIEPLVSTYRHIGIAAYHRPINDIQVEGRKIGGTGAASVGLAEIMVGSLMFDFNHETMAQVLKVPSEKMRDKVFQSIKEYITTMHRELGYLPDRSEIKNLYLEEVSRTLGRPLVAGSVTTSEWQTVAELESRLGSEEWLYQKGGLRESAAVKIHADMHVVEAVRKAPGGLIRVTARLREHRIDDITVSGDFTILPAWAVGALELALRGLPLRADTLLHRVSDVYSLFNVQAPGLSPIDLVEAIIDMEHQT
jgi:lipoate-protein ligase A